jgi:hypothetical protein
MPNPNDATRSGRLDGGPFDYAQTRPEQRRRGGMVGAVATALSPAPWFILFVAAYAVAHVALAFAGRYTNDEGYYLCSSALAMKGLIPYKDFAFWQPPPMLYAYGATGALLGHSLLAQRLVSALFGLAAFLLLAHVLKRRAGRAALYIFGILMVLNMSYAFDTSIVKPPSLSILIYAVALAVAVGGRMTPACAAAASALFAAAVGTRVPLLPMIPFFWAFAYFESERNSRSLLAAVLASVIVLGGGFATWCKLSAGNVLFGVWGYYQRMGSLSSDVFWKWFVPMFLGNQLLIYLLFIGALVALGVLASRKAAQGMRLRDWPARHPFEFFLGGSYIAITLLHLASPVRYPTHQSVNMPLAVLFVAIIAGKGMAKLSGRGRTLAWAALAAAALASIPLQDAPVERSGGLWPYQRIQKVARVLRQRVPEDGRLLAFLNIVAYEGQFELLDGLSMGMEGHFGALGMSTQDCLRYKGVDNRILLQDLAKGAADVVVIQEAVGDVRFELSDIGILDRDRSGVSREEVMAELHRNYDEIGEVLRVGQFGYTAHCYAKKPGLSLRGR